MEFISRLADTTTKTKIVDQLLTGVSGEFDLAVLFVNPMQPYDAKSVYQQVESRIKIKNFLCVTCAGVIGSQREIEYQPAASLLLARLPDVDIKPFYLDQSQLDEFQKSEDVYKFFEIYPHEKPVFLVMPDPFLFDPAQFLDLINHAYPKCGIVGGLASAGHQARENAIILNNKIYDEGLIGYVLTGNVAVETVVSQGCRPVGTTYIVTKAKENVIYELAGRPFYEVLKEVLKHANEYDRKLAQEAIFVGVAMNEYKHQFKRGDFLIRGVMDIDPNSGAGAIADYIQTGQTIQFHLRDARAAQDDLIELLQANKERWSHRHPAGAFVFSCNGRGYNLFGVQDHDIRMIQNTIGPLSAAGFFCAGEIGPVGGLNFLHGFTNSIALFYEPDDQDLTNDKK
ncbi:MAG: FIST C-terminal domain-containing protein [Candidatus Omnitrophica bacterium]|nr:FIST C-terminal domain-containing protein [Candidatus Omnitrophota bacterium]